MNIYRFYVYDDANQIKDQEFGKFVEAIKYAKDGLMPYIYAVPCINGECSDEDQEIIWSWDDVWENEDDLIRLVNERYPEQEEVKDQAEEEIKDELISKSDLFQDEIEEISDPAEEAAEKVNDEICPECKEEKPEQVELLIKAEVPAEIVDEISDEVKVEPKFDDEVIFSDVFDLDFPEDISKDEAEYEERCKDKDCCPYCGQEIIDELEEEVRTVGRSPETELEPEEHEILVISDLSGKEVKEEDAFDVDGEIWDIKELDDYINKDLEIKPINEEDRPKAIRWLLDNHYFRESDIEPDSIVVELKSKSNQFKNPIYWIDNFDFYQWIEDYGREIYGGYPIPQYDLYNGKYELKEDLEKPEQLELDLDIEDNEPVKRCEKCGTRLTDGGYCPKCDDGEEEEIKEDLKPFSSIKGPDMMKLLDIAEKLGYKSMSEIIEFSQNHGNLKNYDLLQALEDELNKKNECLKEDAQSEINNIVDSWGENLKEDVESTFNSRFSLLPEEQQQIVIEKQKDLQCCDWEDDPTDIEYEKKFKDEIDEYNKKRYGFTW